MSIRIHALAKELNVPSKELIDFINQRKDKYGLEIKTSSNAIAPLYAEEIAADYKAMATAANEAPKEEPEAKEESAGAETKPIKYVKTAEDVEAENAKNRRRPKTPVAPKRMRPRRISGRKKRRKKTAATSRRPLSRLRPPPCASPHWRCLRQL